ncbi:MAG: 50S ribosomal protein L17 [Bacteroidales bacterium]
MRHRKKVNSLGRKAAHRKETMSSLATALILNKRINTTVAKAKALRVYVEPLITRAKEDSTHSRRTVFSYLKNKHAVSELFREISQKIADRPGGYTRILKTGFRKGDAAEMCFIELVDYNTAMLKTDEETQQKRTRRGRRGGKKVSSEEGKPAQKPAETKEDQQEVQAGQPEATAPGVKEETVGQKPGANQPETEAKPEAAAKTEAEAKKEAAETKEEQETSEKKKPKADAPKEEKSEKKDESEKKDK